MKKAEIIEDVEVIETALWFPLEKTLVISDIHMGYEDALNKQGYLVPRTQFKESIKIMKGILGKVSPKIVVINGDLKHAFGEISSQEWVDISRFLDLLKEMGRKVILVKGNHDVLLKPIADKKGVDLVDYYCFKSSGKKICALHGHKILEDKIVKEADLLVIGNEHPAVVLEEGVKREKYKCFLLGKWKKQKLIVLPSFLPLIEGTDIKKEELLSPFLHQDLSNFEVFVVGEGVYRFGKLKNV